MPSKDYQNAEAELEKLIQLNKGLSEVNTRLLEGREVLDSLSKYVGDSVTMNVPIMRQYLKDLIEIRMAFARETLDLLRSANELKKLTDSTKSIMDLAKAIVELKKILTPETMEMLKGVIK